MRLSDRINGSKTYDFTKILNESCYCSESEDSTKGEEAEVLTETTNKELEAKKEDLRNRERQALKDLGDENWENLVGINTRLPEDIYKSFKAEEDEIRAISMIHSILTYANESNWTPEYVLDNKYMKRSIENLGEERVRELANQEIEEYKQATVNKDVYTDSEGVTYNSVTFKDDIEESCKEKMKEADEIHGNELNEDSEVITFREIISRMENATEYTDLYDAASLIKDTELRVNVEQLIGDCEDDGDSVETAYSVVTTDLLDSMIDEPNEETAPTE